MKRHARVLLGWLDDAAAKLSLAGRDADVPVSEAQAGRAHAAREAVRRRPQFAGGTAVAGLPADFDDHARRFAETPHGAAALVAGWELALVDLRRVVAAQSTVFFDAETVETRTPAEVALPIDPDVSELTARLDGHAPAWVIETTGTAVSIGRPWQATTDDGEPAFGFTLSASVSMVTVARVNGRDVLTDGYHRSLALLQRGVSHVPALVRDHDPGELRDSVGWLPIECWLGERPPTLADYLDDTVAASVEMPVIESRILILASHLHTP